MKTQRRKRPGGDFPRPFSALEGLLRDRGLRLPEFDGKPAPKRVRSPGASFGDPSHPSSDGGDDLLFQKAMSDVTPISRGDKIDDFTPPVEAWGMAPAEPPGDSEAEALRCLSELVESGQGFVVCQTPEYMDGVAPDAQAGLADRLHRGEFAVQDWVDLHGLTAGEAREAIDGFLRRAVDTGKRGVLIVHGRGLSSPAEPVLKAEVRSRITSGAWRRWVMAYASARSCDGGAGATYILLRHRPAPRRRGERAISRIATGFPSLKDG